MSTPGPVYLTTHQVARMLGVSLPTVVNWTGAGKLKAHRTPGGHRRIAREDLLAFCEAFAYPPPPELAASVGPARVLVVDQERDFYDMLVEYLQLKGGFDLRLAEDPFTTGLEVGRFDPQLLLVDLGHTALDPIRLARLLDEAPEGRRPKLIGVVAFPDAHLERRARSVGYEQLLYQPVSLDGVLDALKQAAG